MRREEALVSVTRGWWVGAMGVALVGCAAGHRSVSASPTHEVQMNGVEAVFGMWSAAADLSGGVTADPIYKNSQVELTATSYTFRMGPGSMALAGTYQVLAWTESDRRLSVSYGGDRTSLKHFELRLGDDGEVVGFVLSEGEDREQARYYAR